jgi:hypothetical protein
LSGCYSAIDVSILFYRELTIGSLVDHSDCQASQFFSGAGSLLSLFALILFFPGSSTIEHHFNLPFLSSPCISCFNLSEPWT